MHLFIVLKWIHFIKYSSIWAHLQTACYLARSQPWTPTEEHSPSPAHAARGPQGCAVSESCRRALRLSVLWELPLNSAGPSGSLGADGLAPSSCPIASFLCGAGLCACVTGLEGSAGEGTGEPACRGAVTEVLRPEAQRCFPAASSRSLFWLSSVERSLLKPCPPLLNNHRNGKHL